MIAYLLESFKNGKTGGTHTVLFHGKTACCGKFHFAARSHNGVNSRGKHTQGRRWGLRQTGHPAAVHRILHPNVIPRAAAPSGFLPEIEPLDVALSQYAIVILGTPVWWYTFAPAMGSFLHSADLSGKRVYPFAANGGWLGHTFQDIERLCRGADVQPGLNVRFNEDRQLTSDAEIQKWVRRILK